MANEVLRIKNDVLNELRNQKYYIQDELRFTIDDTSKTQKQKVQDVIAITDQLVRLDSQITLVENIFVDNTPAPAPAPELEPQGDAEPTNIVEANVLQTDDVEPVAELNSQGQTHAE